MVSILYSIFVLSKRNKRGTANLNILLMASSSFQSKFNELMTKKGITSKKALSVEARKFFVFCLARVQDGNDCPFPDYLVSGFLNSRSNEVTRLYYAYNPVNREAIAYCYANSIEEAEKVLPNFTEDGYRCPHNERLYKVEDSFLSQLTNCTPSGMVVNCQLI